MKRVINGRTYNTATSTALRQWAHSRHSWQNTERLYRTRRGEFFLLIEQTNRLSGAITLREIQPMTDRDVDFWMESCRRREEGWFEDLTEYSPETVLYLRIPELLKARLSNCAKRRGLSLNAWLTEQLAAVAEHEQGSAMNEAFSSNPTQD